MKLYFFIPSIALPKNLIDYWDEHLTAIIYDCPECSIIYIPHI